MLSRLEAPDAPWEDHRVRVARNKRERTRAHLLDAVLSVYPGTAGAPAVIDDVIRDAHVSRGTFYKYFPSLEQAVSELGTQLADEMAVDYARIYEDVADPRLRTATGFQLFLSRAVIEPRWGSFVVHLSHLNPASELRVQVLNDLTRGVQAGTYVVRQNEVAIDFIIGVMIEGVRQIIAGIEGSTRSYIQDMAGMVLRGLGLSASAADQSAAAASARLHREGPEKLSWWKGFE